MAVFDGVTPAIVGAANAAGGDLEIERSLRFDDTSNGNLTRTPSTAGNRKTWTLSFWIKRTEIGGTQYIFNAGNTSNGDHSVMRINSDQLQMYQYGHGGDTTAWSGGNGSQLRLDAVFRDPGAWMHIVVAMDTTQATQSDRLKYYVNGVEQTDFSSTSYPVQDSNPGYWNAADLHCIGGIVQNTSPSGQSDYYLAEVHMVDGQQLAASDFGGYDDNNIWQPSAYSGSYGTNGFYLKFDDYSSDAALGTDSSGNNNTWTVNNITAPGHGIVYSNSLTTNTTISTGSLQSPFDGDTSTYVYGNDPGAGYFLFSGVSISYTTSLEVYYPSGVPSATFELNGSSITIPTSNAWNTIATGSGTLTSLKVSRGGDSWFFSAIRVDGTILVDDDPANWDSLIDTPLGYTADSGNNGGNYCTWSPIDSTGTNTLTNGNLECSGAQRGNRGTIAVTSGKYYYETVITTFGAGGDFGWSKSDEDCPTTDPGANSYGWSVHTSGLKRHNGSTSSYISGGLAVGDVIQFAIDVDAGKVWFGKNNTWGASGDPAAGTNAAFTNVTGPIAPAHGNGGSAIAFTTNFGQRPFTYTPPTGYVSLCTQNLTDPTIADSTTVFDTKLYTGTGSSFDLAYNFSPDFAWIKGRSYTSNGQLSDTIRSASGNKRFELPTGNAEDPGGPGFLSTGLNINTNAAINTNGETYVSWAWDGGTSTVSNTDGSITSQVRANSSAGFSVVTWSGNSQNATVGHGLGAIPQMIIHKRRNGAASFITYHEGIGNTNALQFNAPDALINNSYFDNKSPTTTIFNVSDFDETNRTGNTYVAYCWAPVEGYSAFGSYEGNGNANGPFVYTGFRPKFLLLKNADANGVWSVFDTERDPYNVMDARLQSDSTAAEGNSTTNPNIVDSLSNGFKVRYSGQNFNGNNNTIVYAAFAEHPFKISRAR